MPPILRRVVFLLTACILGYFIFSYPSYVQNAFRDGESSPFSFLTHPWHLNDANFAWKDIPERYPVTSFIPLPTGKPRKISKIQHTFRRQSREARETDRHRLAAVLGNFTHAWDGYKNYAWMNDELAPKTGDAHNPFGGWAATLVDSLDTLWIMGLKTDFEAAVEAIDKINFNNCALEELNVFETTIRYLGGFLGAYDISDGKYPKLLEKAVEVGDMLYHAFDTPNRMPITRWNFKAAARGDRQQAPEFVVVAEIGSLTLEFTRLTQLTGDPRYYDAIARIMNVFDAQQNQTLLPGMWPIGVNARAANFVQDTLFTIGGMADSVYEYLPKQHLLLGGATPQYQKLYENAIEPIKQHILYRPMTPNGDDILLPGELIAHGTMPTLELKTAPKAEHLGCFAGGMVGIGARIFGNDEDLSVARRLVEGCLWGYESMPLGIMPEVMHTVPCGDDDPECPWDEERWHTCVNRAHQGSGSASEKIEDHHLPPGVVEINDARYILRPEAIESVFILYRITGDAALKNRAWAMFNNIIRWSLTHIAHAALADCTVPWDTTMDSMESFWLAETLKYFYLIFADPGLVSLDEYVFNTEAHPLKRPA